MEKCSELKTARLFTIKKNLLFQLLLIPICTSAGLLLPLFITWFISFIGIGNDYFGMYIAIYILSGLTSILFAFLFSLRIKKVNEEKRLINQLLIFLTPILNIFIIGILYFLVSVESVTTAAIIINPALFISNIAGNAFLKNFVPVAMLVSTSCSSVAFFLFSYKKFKISKNTEEYLKQKVETANGPIEHKFKQKKVNNILFTAMSLVLVLSITLSTAIWLPEIEYIDAEKKYERMNFDEEIDALDFDFSEKLPFANPSNVAVLSEPSTLVFENLETTPRIDGATAFYPMYSAFVQATYLGFYEALKHHDVNDEIWVRMFANEYGSGIVNCTKTNQSYQQLINKRTDIIFAFEPSSGQLQEAAQKGVELKLTKIGYDAFCFFVNTKNPVNNLSLSDVQKIYTGKIDNWRKVGGNNKRIFAFTRPEGSGSQTIMENVVMKGLEIDKKYQSKVTYTMGGMLHVVDGYLNTPNAIGYTFMFYSSSMVTADSIKYLSINGISPTPETVKNGTYLFSVPFYAITRKGEETAETSEFLSWIIGNQGQELITNTGYVGL